MTLEPTSIPDAAYARLDRACPSCRSASRSPECVVRDHFSGDAYRVVRCDACRLLYLHDAPDERTIHLHYQNFAGVNMHKAPGALFRVLRDVAFGREYASLVKRIGPRGRVLELGTGDGALAQYLALRGCDVLACDVYDASEWPHPAIGYRSADLNALPDECLRGQHAVIMRHVFEHVHHPGQLVDAFKRNGVEHVHLLVPNAASPFVRIFGEDWCSWDPPRHLQFFEPETLDGLMTSHGYRLTQTTDHGIDEVVVSLFRRRMLRSHLDLRTPTPDISKTWWFRLYQPKGVLCTISAALSANLVPSVLSRLYTLQ